MEYSSFKQYKCHIPLRFWTPLSILEKNILIFFLHTFRLDMGKLNLRESIEISCIELGKYQKWVLS